MLSKIKNFQTQLLNFLIKIKNLEIKSVLFYSCTLFLLGTFLYVVYILIKRYFKVKKENEIQLFIKNNPTLDVECILKLLADFRCAVITQNTAQLDSLISPDEPFLLKNINNCIQDTFLYRTRLVTYPLEFYPLKKYIKILNSNTIKIIANQKRKYLKSGDSVRRFKHYFILQKHNGVWVIIDTNFHIKLKYIKFFGIILIVFIIIGLIAIALMK